MPRHSGNSHRGPSHRRKSGHRMHRGHSTEKVSKLKKLTIAGRPIQKTREEDHRNAHYAVGATSPATTEAVR